MSKRTQPSIYETITNRIIAALEAGTLPWHRPWRSLLPRNAASGREYRGINSLLLSLTALERQYESSGWVTYLQAQQLGGQVRRGEKATAIVFWKQIDRPSTQPSNESDEAEHPERFWLARTYSVFNLAQVDGLERLRDVQTVRPADHDAIAAWEAVTGGYEIEIRHGGDQAYYSPSTDHVQMPPAALFESTERYLGVLAHELVHSTGAPHRLSRDLSGRFGSEAYAMEELIAELGSAFLTARCGLPHHTQANAAYVASWLKVLRNDSRAILTAARLAQLAADFITPTDENATRSSDQEIAAA